MEAAVPPWLNDRMLTSVAALSSFAGGGPQALERLAEAVGVGLPVRRIRRQFGHQARGFFTCLRGAVGVDDEQELLFQALDVIGFLRREFLRFDKQCFATVLAHFFDFFVVAFVLRAIGRRRHMSRRRFRLRRLNASHYGFRFCGSWSQ